jgi:hypothetical protein
VAKTLVAYEILWYDAWVKSIEAAKAGLHATLIIKHLVQNKSSDHKPPAEYKYLVNFDHEILQLVQVRSTNHHHHHHHHHHHYHHHHHHHLLAHTQTGHCEMTEWYSGRVMPLHRWLQLNPEFSCVAPQESKCLARMKVEVPEAARMVMMQEDKYKLYYNQLRSMLAEHDTVVGKIYPILRKVHDQLQNSSVKHTYHMTGSSG